MSDTRAFMAYKREGNNMALCPVCHDDRTIERRSDDAHGIVYVRTHCANCGYAFYDDEPRVETQDDDEQEGDE